MDGTVRNQLKYSYLECLQLVSPKEAAVPFQIPTGWFQTAKKARKSEFFNYRKKRGDE
jgi:hypothetical protein